MLVQFQQILKFYQSFRLRLNVKHEKCSAQKKLLVLIWFMPPLFLFATKNNHFLLSKTFLCVCFFSSWYKKTLLQTLLKNFEYFSDYLHVYLALLSLIMETTKTEYLKINVFQKLIWKYQEDCLLCPKQFDSFWVGGTRPEVNSF